MPTITKDGVEIFYKDWGSGQPIVFSHGWPLSADDWDNQMMFFLGKAYRVIAHDRRGAWALDAGGDGTIWTITRMTLGRLTAHLGLKDAIHVGALDGGGEVGTSGRVATGRVKAAIISAVPPLMLKTMPTRRACRSSVFDDLQAQLAANRSKFYRDLAGGAFL